MIVFLKNMTFFAMTYSSIREDVRLQCSYHLHIDGVLKFVSPILKKIMFTLDTYQTYFVVEII